MRKEDRLVASAAAAAKHKASTIIDATAKLATATAHKAGIEVHRAADLAKDAAKEVAKEVGHGMAKAGEKVQDSGDRLLKLAK
jgi:hypothetical protein